jgi:hypothetical protein
MRLRALFERRGAVGGICQKLPGLTGVWRAARSGAERFRGRGEAPRDGHKAKGAGSLAGSRPLLSELFEDLASATRTQLPDAAVARGLRACAPAPRARSVIVPLREPFRRRLKPVVAHRFPGTPVARCSEEAPVTRHSLKFVSALIGDAGCPVPPQIRRPACNSGCPLLPAARFRFLVDLGCPLPASPRFG